MNTLRNKSPWNLSLSVFLVMQKNSAVLNLLHLGQSVDSSLHILQPKIDA